MISYYRYIHNELINTSNSHSINFHNNGVISSLDLTLRLRVPGERRTVLRVTTVVDFSLSEQSVTVNCFTLATCTDPRASNL